MLLTIQFDLIYSQQMLSLLLAAQYLNTTQLNKTF